MELYKKFFHLVIPSMMAFALSGVYAVADGYFVGNALGDQALAAINIAYPLTAFLQAAGTGIGMGGAVQYSICKAAKKTEEQKRYFGMSIGLLAAAGILLTVLLSTASPLILKALGAYGSMLKFGNEYIRSIALRAVFQIAGTGLVPFIRNMGSSITAMAAMTAGFITNIVLDYLFVWKLPYGMSGAALATIIGQAVTLFICLAYFIIKKEKPLFRGSASGTVKKILAVGVSPFGLAFTPNIILILVNKWAAVYGGDFAVTCYAPVSYLSATVMLLLQGVSDGSQPLASLYYGRGENEAVKRIYHMSRSFAAAVAVCCMAILFFGRRQAALLFGASDSVTSYVAEILPIFIAGFLFVSFSRTTTSYFYATEKNWSAYLLIYGEPLCLLLLLLILPAVTGIAGIWTAVLITQIFIALLSFLLLRR